MTMQKRWFKCPHCGQLTYKDELHACIDLTRKKKKKRKNGAWRKRRIKVLERDDYACVDCGSFGILYVLEVHHKIHSEMGGSDKMKNLETLCVPCHEAKHPWRVLK